MSTRIIYVGLLFLSLSIQGCIEKQGDPGEPGQQFWENHIPFQTNYNPLNLPFTEDFEPTPLTKGEVNMTEASGIAWSIKNPGTIWAHNDSGNTNELFLLEAETGKTLCRFEVTGSINLDWEDMEVSTGPVDGESYIYIADTGDNYELRRNYTIYRFVEPVYEPAFEGKSISLENQVLDRIRFDYPDGSHNTEAMLVDPTTKDIFLITKSDVVSMLYVVPYPQPINELFPIFKAGEFSFRRATAANSSTDGKKVIIKNREEIFYWEKTGDESMVELLSTTPKKAPYLGEPIGEAICFDLENNYFTLSEKPNSSTPVNLYKYIYNKF